MLSVRANIKASIRYVIGTEYSRHANNHIAIAAPKGTVKLSSTFILIDSNSAPVIAPIKLKNTIFSITTGIPEEIAIQ